MNKSVLKTLFAGLAAFFLALCLGTAGTSADADHVAESEAECVIEVSSRRVLHEKNGSDCLPMASTTKIMTAILILDDCDLTEEIAVPKEAEGVEGSSVYLRAGDVYTVEELLYGMMLRSGNDCATALAIHHSGSVEAFARAMNEKAALLGAEDTFFVNPHGLPAKGHHTTARDLALLSAYAMENPTFEKVVSTKYYARHKWQNKNKMLWNFGGACGVKTGFTTQAGRCLVTSAVRDGMKLVCVVLNSPQMYERTAQLLENAFQNYRLETVFDCAEPLGGLLAKYSFRYPLAAGEREQISITTKKCEPLPQTRGDFAGTMQIFLKNSLIFSQNLYIM